MTATLKVSEADFTTTVIEYAMLKGWRVCHFRPARTEKGWRTALQGHRGWFDIMAARMGRLVLAELKAEGGSQDDDQCEWWNQVVPNESVEVYLWRPSDFDRIKEVLA